MKTLLQLPFRITWNILVLAGIISAFISLWGFLLGSVLGFVVVLVFAPGILISPLLLLGLVVPFWAE